MSIKIKHNSGHPLQFCTFTCYKWLHLFEITQSYDYVRKWFSYLADKKKVDVISYVVMPNHVHLILHLPSTDLDLNKVISNGKRFLAYEIINAWNKVIILICWNCFMPA